MAADTLSCTRANVHAAVISGPVRVADAAAVCVPEGVGDTVIALKLRWTKAAIADIMTDAHIHRAIPASPEVGTFAVAKGVW
jgi:hypothetical protein